MTIVLFLIGWPVTAGALAVLLGGAVDLRDRRG